MKQAEIWLHMKKVPMIRTLCTRLLYFDRVCRPENTGNSNCEMQLGMIIRSWILSKEYKGKKALMHPVPIYPGWKAVCAVGTGKEWRRTRAW
jgi:hypothetical protein